MVKIQKRDYVTCTRDYSLGQYLEIAEQLVERYLNVQASFKGCVMTYNNFQTTSYQNSKHPQIDVFIDFINHEFIIVQH